MITTKCNEIDKQEIRNKNCFLPYFTRIDCNINTCTYSVVLYSKSNLNMRTVLYSGIFKVLESVRGVFRQTLLRVKE